MKEKVVVTKTFVRNGIVCVTLPFCLIKVDLARELKLAAGYIFCLGKLTFLLSSKSKWVGNKWNNVPCLNTKDGMF